MDYCPGKDGVKAGGVLGLLAGVRQAFGLSPSLLDVSRPGMRASGWVLGVGFGIQFNVLGI